MKSDSPEKVKNSHYFLGFRKNAEKTKTKKLEFLLYLLFKNFIRNAKNHHKKLPNPK